MANYNLTQTGEEVQRILNSVQTIDNSVTQNSSHPVTGGAVFTALSNTVAESGVYDVTVNNNNAKFASLSALLNSENLDTLIPIARRKGGMSIKFVHTYDNKYAQYRLTSNTFTTNVSEWQKQGAEVTVSQNTETGHTDISVGDTITPVASVEDIMKIKGGDIDREVEFINGKFYLPNGDLYTSEYFKYSDAINVEGFKTLKLSGSFNHSSSACCLFYKSDDTIKSFIVEENLNVENTYDLADVSYVKLSFSISSVVNLALTIVGSEEAINERIDEIEKDIIDIDGGDPVISPNYNLGKIYLSTGEEYQFEHGKYTNAIDTSNAKKFKIAGTFRSGSSACCLFYKEDNTLMRAIEEDAFAQGLVSELDITDIAYMKLSFYDTTNPTITLEIIGEIENLSERINNNAEGIQNINEALSSDYAELTRRNLIDLSKCTSNKYVSYADGLIRDLDGCSVTDFIEVESESDYTFSVEQNAPTTAISQWAFYDTSKQYVSGLANSRLYGRVSITIPSGVKYIRLTLLTNSLNYSMLAKGGIRKEYAPYDSKFIQEKNIPFMIRKEVTVGNTYSADFQSILRALKETSNDTIIHITAGTYDIVAEYEDYYGADFFDNYDGYDAHPEDDFYKGLWLGEGREIYGESKTILQFNYNGDNPIVNRDFSILNTAGRNKIFNLTFDSNHTGRYHIHDDFQNPVAAESIVSINEYKNLIFLGKPSTSIYIGAGVGTNSGTYIIESCVFTEESTYDISYHGSTSENVDVRAKIFVKDCCGLGVCAFRWYGVSVGVTQCYVSGCKFKNIVCEASSAGQTNVNMALTEWNNTTTV